MAVILEEPSARFRQVVPTNDIHFDLLHVRIASLFSHKLFAVEIITGRTWTPLRIHNNKPDFNVICSNILVPYIEKQVMRIPYSNEIGRLVNGDSQSSHSVIISCGKSSRKRDLDVKNNSTNRNHFLSSRTYSQEFENAVWTHDQEEKEKKKKTGKVALLDTRKSSCKNQPKAITANLPQGTRSVGDRLCSVSANVLSCPIFLLSYFYSKVLTLSCAELFQA